MDLSSLSDEELTRSLRSVRHPIAPDTGGAAERIESLMQALHVQRLELEMQNRALRDAQAEMEAALQRYCDLYDHLPIGYITLTSKGLIVQANPTAAEWLQRDRATLVGNYFHWFLDAFDAGRFHAHLEACSGTADEQLLEVTLRLESGLLMTVQLTSRLALPGPGERHIHTAITNISKLQQTHAISEDIDREHKTFTQFITDHVRTPVATISKFARTILQDHATELGPAVKSNVERMECAAVRTESTLQHLLEYACHGHEDVALDPVNLEELMQQVILEHRVSIQRHQADITVERPLPCVRGARLLLAQVLANVLANILKHSTPDGPAHIRVTAAQTAEEVVLQIREEGSALELQEEHRNFKMFERLHEKDCLTGGGIGLAIIRDVVERMHGRVWVESSARSGTSLNIGLPAV